MLASRSDLSVYDAFSDALNGRPTNTRRAYTADVLQLGAYLIDHYLATTDLSPVVMAGYHEHLKQLGLRPGSIARKLSACNTLGKWLRAEGLITSAPTVDTHWAAVRRRPRRVLTADEWARLRAVMARDQTPAGVRDRTILAVQEATGWRISRILALNVMEYETLSPGVHAAVRTYVADSWPYTTNTLYIGNYPIFLGRAGGRLTRHAYWFRMKAFARRAGITGVTSEVLRRGAVK